MPDVVVTNIIHEAIKLMKKQKTEDDKPRLIKKVLLCNADDMSEHTLVYSPSKGLINQWNLFDRLDFSDPTEEVVLYNKEYKSPKGLALEVWYKDGAIDTVIL